MPTRKDQLFYISMDVEDLERVFKKTVVSYENIIIHELDHSEDDNLKFIKELTNIVKQLVIPVEVYARDKEIQVGYCLEKLNTAKSMLDYTINYFKGKLKK